MKTLCRLLAVVALLILPPLPVAAQNAAPEKVYNAERFTLKNGMEVVVIPNHRAPVVTHMLWYKVGAADEPRGLSGMAHYLEHLLFKGTPTLPPGEYSRRIRALGGDDNAFTANDYTAFFESIAVEHLETVMKMQADRMMNTSPPPADFTAEQKVVLEERRQRTENDPKGFFAEQLKALLFINHPYGIPVIGWEHEVAALAWPEIESFYKRHYGPNNAILVVSGDITAAQLKPLAERYYGPLKPIALPGRVWTKVPPMIALPQLTLHHPDIRQPLFMRIYRAPSLPQSRAEGRALSLLTEILNGSAATRLYKSIVVEKKLATSVGFDYDGIKISDGAIWISASPADGVSLETLEAAIDEELRKLIRDGVTDQELAEAKIRMQDSAAFARDSLSGPAMTVGQVLAVGLTLDDAEYWPRDIESVTRDQVQAAAKTYLDPDDIGQRPYISGYLLPEKTAAASAEPAIANTPEQP
ncbi:MAG: insulinase family protein [Micavibrio aeruginosavorus]|uniref:Insulinase family protein n=1 Tax=Micavibrio aeruginosavorus TaxID=349221 RepID=A0A7T5UGQ9_9BACT|nr:MAG: insulinase family protein [Micavibrio aeruginosavorus]